MLYRAVPLAVVSLFAIVFATVVRAEQQRLDGPYHLSIGYTSTNSVSGSLSPNPQSGYVIEAAFEAVRHRSMTLLIGAGYSTRGKRYDQRNYIVFPVLIGLRGQSGVLRPYVQTGPSLDVATGNSWGTETVVMSGHAGLGIEVHDVIPVPMRLEARYVENITPDEIYSSRYGFDTRERRFRHRTLSIMFGVII